jgi:ankyrin repeat protein
MSQKPPTRAMRENPDLDQLKRQAKELLESYRAQQSEAVTEVNFYHPTATPDAIALHDAQFVLARSYGFESWPKLTAAVDGVTSAKLHQAAQSGNLVQVRELLSRRPELGRGERRFLQIAVLKRDLALTQLLLEFGADPGGGEWTSPEVIARDRGYDEIVDAIRAARTKRGERGLQGPTEAVRKFEQAAKSGNEEALCAVLDEHPELAEITPANGMTMLHQAASHGAVRITKWLLDHGADVNHRPRRRLALRRPQVRAHRKGSPRSRRAPHASLRRDAGPLGLPGEAFEARTGKERTGGGLSQGQSD